MTETIYGGAARPWREAPIDRKRLRRSQLMTILRASTRETFIVLSPSGESYWVNLRDDAESVCDCPDHLYHEVLCAHALAALFAVGDPRVFQERVLEQFLAAA